MKKYKTTLSAQNARELVVCIEHLFSNEPEYCCLSEMVALAALAEVAQAIKKKTVEYKREYKITFSGAQAIAISFMYLEYIKGNENQFTNRMMQINNEILQRYAI